MRSKNKEIDFEFCQLSGVEGPFIIGYKIRSSSRIKNLQIQVVDRDKVLIKKPKRIGDKKALAFLQQNGEWLWKAIQSHPKVIPLKEYLFQKPRISAFGKWVDLEFKFNLRSAKKFKIGIGFKEIEIYLNHIDDYDLQLTKILKKLAREILIPRVGELSIQKGVKVHGVSIRDQERRWGSCSETSSISLNWRLILLPPSLQDHIILHELCHLLHFDHSPAFYECLKRWDPQSEINSASVDKLSHQMIGMGRVAS